MFCKSFITWTFGLIDHFVTVSKKNFRAGEGFPSSLHPLSYHADPLTPEDSSLPLQVLSSFPGLHPLSRGSASPCPSCEAILTTRQDSLDVTVWHVARPVSGFLSIRFYAKLSPYADILTTRGLGPSHGRTFNG